MPVRRAPAVAKRFYERAAVLAEGEDHLVILDGRPVRTPAEERLALRSRPLAEAIAAEWEAQEEEVRPGSMPLTRLAATAIDRVAPQRARVIDEIAAYGATDLLCYRAAGPDELVERQARLWQPLLDRAARRFGARLEVTQRVAPIRQDEAPLAALRRAIEGHDDVGLTALLSATVVTGSLVIALLVSVGELDAESAWRAATLDEAYQAETWGEDGEAAAAREERRRDLFAAARVMELCRG